MRRFIRGGKTGQTLRISGVVAQRIIERVRCTGELEIKIIRANHGEAALEFSLDGGETTLTEPAEPA